MSDNQKELKYKIEKLVKSKQSENNYIALTLMQTQLGMSFEESFNALEITLVKEASLFTDNIYLVKILDYNIYYAVEHCWATIKEYPFLEIRRTIKQSLKVLNKYNKIFTIDFFESENQRDMFEAMSALPNLGEGLEELLS
ncbi:MAG: hypothetical protein MK207_15190 [Saprospiraceae bacterium]|nr:hypothetical protein [Saprospiraceae bacterium]